MQNNIINLYRITIEPWWYIYICNKILRLLCHTSSFSLSKAKYLETCNTNNKLDFADVVEITTILCMLCIYKELESYKTKVTLCVSLYI